MATSHGEAHAMGLSRGTRLCANEDPLQAPVRGHARCPAAGPRVPDQDGLANPRTANVDPSVSVTFHEIHSVLLMSSDWRNSDELTSLAEQATMFYMYGVHVG
jgi:hypothetical protein